MAVQTGVPGMSFTRSMEDANRLRRLVPGGAHTYAKGPDQYPLDVAPIISRGHGSHVWDVDGNEYIEYGSGLRSVILGHGRPEVIEAVRAQLEHGTNFARPSAIEGEVAERFLEMVPAADQVKFAKNGSDVTTAAVRLARAYTGRDLVAVCADQPFFSTDDWFIGSTPMDAGIPQAVRDLTVTFPYGDLSAAEEVLSRHDGNIACLILEPGEPPEGYLTELLQLAHRHGALLVLDEMITGFRWAYGGGQALYGVEPDLSTFGKALGNGFAISALAGRKNIMRLGGMDHAQERVFLLSTTHGAETHSMAAALAVMDLFAEDDLVGHLESIGERLTAGVRMVVAEAGMQEHITLHGRPSNIVFATLDQEGEPSQIYRTLFMRELLMAGVLAPSFVPSIALTDDDIRHTVEAVGRAALTYRKAMEAGDPSSWLGGRPVKPVFRKFA